MFSKNKVAKKAIKAKLKSNKKANKDTLKMAKKLKKDPKIQSTDFGNFDK